MSDNITLICLIYGDLTEKAFEVKIEKNKSVSLLKEKIKDKNSNLFDGVDAKDIVLWKVNIPIGGDIMEVDIVLENNKKIGVQKLSYPTKKIDSIFTENITDESIHIIVERPSGKCINAICSYNKLNINLSHNHIKFFC